MTRGSSIETNASFSGWSRPPLGWLARYARWLHTGWPAGTVEPLPEAAPDGTTAVPGLRIVGDLTGIPLLKLAADSGARAGRAIAAEPDFAVRRDGGDGHGGAAATDVLDLAIVGAGVAGISAALEAKKAGIHKKVTLLLGGPRVDHKLALELGFDAGFGPGTKPSDVANFVVHQVLQRMGKEDRGTHWQGEPA